MGKPLIAMNVPQLWVHKKSLMKIITNVIITHAIFLALFASAALAFAQVPVSDSAQSGADTATATSAASQARQSGDLPDRETMREAATERREAMQERAAERRVQLQERAQERVTNLAANMSNRMDATIARFQNIIDRLESRMEKLVAAGVDTAAATEAVGNAQVSLDAARTEIAAIDTAVTTAVGAEDVRTAWATVRESFTTTREYLRQSHQELRATVAALKEAVQNAEGTSGVSEAVRANTATSTATGTGAIAN